ncbi:hypothetical protein [Galbibacter pacificus]|uniref:Uncharacterized protein n=1 Tax=Galbibacter pacificus TaxID=2996052 RepID=A0ABT6FQT3_9FLAO|nr:hypothetical protein [Galbibacter pacificus]MDG3582039.1 hypothetical protein [Galbibacter pacificus]MDG3585487.1 hypothetical protein [Galbibacter pacificus]
MNNNIPIVLKKNIVSTFINIRNVVEKNSEFIRIVRDDSFIIHIEDIKNELGFKWIISTPEFARNRVSYNIEFIPKSRIDNGIKKQTYDSSMVIKNLEGWINLIKDHSNFNPHPNSNMFNHYRNNIFEKFISLDPDAKTLPFDDEAQLAIKSFTSKLLLELKNEDIEDGEYVDSVKDLDENIGNYTKQQVLDKFADIYAKTRIAGGKIFTAFVNVLKKNVPPFLIEKGLEYVYQLGAAAITHMIN